MKKSFLIILLFVLSVQSENAYTVPSKDGYLRCLVASTLNTYWKSYVDSSSVKDFTGSLDDLGIPYEKMYPGGEKFYARNPWDLKVFGNRLYVGAGNSSNKGPAVNSGPVAVIYFDPRSGRFIKEVLVDEEQLDLYREFNDHLYIPGHDTTQSWKLGNYYRKSSEEEWGKKRNIPGALHVYDLAWHGQEMFAALGTRKGAAVAISTDDGQSWKVQNIGKNRVYSFVKVRNKLFAMKRIPTHGQVIRNEKLFGVAEFKQPRSFIPRYDLRTSDIFPSGYLLENKQKKVVRSVQYDGKTFYIGAYIHNDHQYLPFGVFAATSFDENHLDVERICLPNQYRPWDLLVSDGYLYILIEQLGTRGDGTIVKVLRSKGGDPSKWEEYFQFSAATFARSFEIMDRDFYFGLGCETNDPDHWEQKELNPSTGKILRVRGDLLNSS